MLITRPSVCVKSWTVDSRQSRVGHERNNDNNSARIVQQLTHKFISMCEKSPTSPSFKSALNYFNSLDRQEKSSAPPPILPRPKRHDDTEIPHRRPPNKPKVRQERLISKIYTSFEDRIKDLHYIEPFDRLAPDLQAKQIMKIFKKEISPYNTFEIPFDAMDSAFFRQSLAVAVPVGDRRRVGKSAVRTVNSYRLPGGQNNRIRWGRFLESFELEVSR